MAYEELKESVFEANLQLVRSGLVILTWGNASAVDRDAGVVAIKPSGVEYATLTSDDIVIVSLASGAIIEGDLCASSDTPTHLVLYREFEFMGAITHTHSTCATAWAQACREIPCLGTTHADFAAGAVPVTRLMRREEIEGDYEANTGKVVAECLRLPEHEGSAPPAALVAGHGPFTWGATAAEAVENALILEEIARMALHTLAVNPEIKPIGKVLHEKHWSRKHGPGSYYGQSKEPPASD